MVWGLRVLLVDFDLNLRTRLRDACEKEGWIVEESSSLSDAAWRCSGFGADVVVASSKLRGGEAVQMLLPERGVWTLFYGEAGESEYGLLRLTSDDPLIIVRALRIMEREITPAPSGDQVIVIRDSVPVF